MARRSALAGMVVVVSVALAACTPQELGDFLAATDLHESEKPAEAAAGDAATAVEVDRTAQQLADEGLRDESPEKLDQAQALRQSDARYVAYRVAMAVADGDMETAQDGFDDGYHLYVKARTGNAEWGTTEMLSEWTLIYLGGVDRALAIERDRTPHEQDRIDRLQRTFCTELRFYLATADATRRDVMSVMFAGGADCPGA
jgi:hypothetical protein